MREIYQSITPLLGEIVKHKKTGKLYSIAHQTTTVSGKPVVWVAGERGKSKSGYRSVEQVIRDYERCYV